MMPRLVRRALCFAGELGRLLCLLLACVGLLGLISPWILGWLIRTYVGADIVYWLDRLALWGFVALAVLGFIISRRDVRHR